MTKFWAPIISK